MVLFIFGNSPGSLSHHFLAYSWKLGNRSSSEGLRSFKPSRGTNLLVLIILAGNMKMNPDPRSQCRQCKKYCKATDKVVKCQECSECFHLSWANLSEKELLELGSENKSWTPLKLLRSQLQKIKCKHKGNKPPPPPPQSMVWWTSISETLFGQIDSTNQVHH